MSNTDSVGTYYYVNDVHDAPLTRKASGPLGYKLENKKRDRRKGM